MDGDPCTFRELHFRPLMNGDNLYHNSDISASPFTPHAANPILRPLSVKPIIASSHRSWMLQNSCETNVFSIVECPIYLKALLIVWPAHGEHFFQKEIEASTIIVR